MVSLGRNIYLAGKIGKNDWRHEIVPLRGCDWEFLPMNERRLNDLQSWPVFLRAIFAEFHYVGPFFVSCDHGCYHGHTKHGTLPASGLAEEHGNLIFYAQDECREVLPIITELGHPWGSEYQSILAARKQVIALCKDAIRRADLVFAWVDSFDAYGTIFELGFAHALGKKVVICLDEEALLKHVGLEEHLQDDRRWLAGSELWFMQYACQTVFADGRTPSQVLSDILRNLGWFDLAAVYESPLEAMFAQEWVHQSLHLVYPLTYQHPIKNGAYRLDFGYEPALFGIELDGYTYHSDRESFTHDRQRQREIEALGWRIVRFSGDELRHDITRCVQEAARLLDIQKRTKE